MANLPGSGRHSRSARVFLAAQDDGARACTKTLNEALQDPVLVDNQEILGPPCRHFHHLGEFPACMCDR